MESNEIEIEKGWSDERQSGSLSLPPPEVKGYATQRRNCELFCVYIFNSVIFHPRSVGCTLSHPSAGEAHRRKEIKHCWSEELYYLGMCVMNEFV